MMVLCKLFVLLLGAAEIHSLDTLPRCPLGWIPNGQSCWMAVIGTQLGMAKAQETCQRINSNLAVPNSKAENDFLYGLFKETWPNPERSLWLGCMAKLPNNALMCFQNLTGPEGYYTFDTSSGPDNRCVVLAKSGMRWFGTDCSRWRYTICERPATSLTRTFQCSAISLTRGYSTQSCCLLNHTFSVTQTKSPIQCCIACIKDPKCHSFNLSGKACQLNNVTIAQVDQGKYLNLEDGCRYYETN